MSKYSSDSNSHSRERIKSHSRYYKQKHRSSSSSSSTENSKHSTRHSSSTSKSRHYKKSKRRHRSSSSSNYSSSRRKSSKSSHHKHKSRSKKKYKRSSSSSSKSSLSDSSNKNHNSKSSKSFNNKEKKKKSVPVTKSTIKTETSVNYSETDKFIGQEINWVQDNVYDVMKRENSIAQINQEGFVFKVFKPSGDQKEDGTIENTTITPKLNEIINSLPVEESTFIITNGTGLLNARYKLLTKQERCNNWAKQLFETYKQLDNIKNINGQLE